MKTPDRDLVADALEGKRGDEQQRIALKVVEFAALMLRKNADYGCAVWKSPVLSPSMPARSAILVRMSDKISRLASLASKPPEVVGESVDDTMKDLAAYALLYLAEPKPEASP